MSNTYIGWDGKEYPWPPPEGWYHAADGRWWAPDTGPNPPSQAAAQSQATAIASDSTGPQNEAPQGIAPGQGAVGQGGQGLSASGPSSQAVDQANLHTIQISAEADPLATRSFDPQSSAQDQATSILSPDSTNSLPQADSGTGQMPVASSSPGATVRGAPPAGLPPGRGGKFTPAGAPAFQPAKKKGGLGQALLIIVSMIAIVLVGGFAYFYFTSDSGSDTAATSDSALSDDSATDTSGDTGTDDDAAADQPQGETDPTADGADTDVTTADEAPATSTPAASDSTTTTVSDPTTTAQTLNLVDGFRIILEQNDLSSESLSDEQIQRFATEFCDRARAATDAPDFNSARNDAIAATQSALSPQELALVINAAVITFCPEEAARLNVTP